MKENKSTLSTPYKEPLQKAFARVKDIKGPERINGGERVFDQEPFREWFKVYGENNMNLDQFGNVLMDMNQAICRYLWTTSHKHPYLYTVESAFEFLDLDYVGMASDVSTSATMSKRASALGVHRKTIKMISFALMRGGELNKYPLLPIYLTKNEGSIRTDGTLAKGISIASFISMSKDLLERMAASRIRAWRWMRQFWRVDRV